MSWSGNMARRARFRGLTEGRVQTAKSEVFDANGRDRAERHQDYGFAGMPVSGEGIRFELGGHTFIMRMDRTAERPELAAYEVAVWHKEQHMVVLRAGRVVEVVCDRLVVNASDKVVLNTPRVEGPGDAEFAGTVTGQTDVVFAGISGLYHAHGGIERGDDVSDGPQ